MSEDLTTKKAHLAALEAFIGSVAHTAYQDALMLDIQNIKDAIVVMIPDSIANFVMECQLKGELRALESRVSLFEDARSSLEARIDAIVETELETATQVR